MFVFDIYTGEEIVEYDLSLIPGKIISKREYRRENEKTLQELKDHVIHMFAEENWKCFTARNFKAFPRYVRDQCIEAKKYFLAKDIDIFILDKALEYCLENNTLSFANLNDTYAYFKREHERSKELLLEEAMENLTREYQGGHEPLPVRKRDLSVYKEIISNREKAIT